MQINQVKKQGFFLHMAVIFLAFLISCSAPQKKVLDLSKERASISAMLDSFNVAAARADFNRYFSFYDSGAIFIGTDATERWTKDSFMVWSKPYFDKGRAWNFSSVQRDIYFSEDGGTAWFDELLNTQMKICRGSGVLAKIGDDWKIRQYVLSTTIPNRIIDTVISLKAAEEDSILSSIKK